MSRPHSKFSGVMKFSSRIGDDLIDKPYTAEDFGKSWEDAELPFNELKLFDFSKIAEPTDPSCYAQNRQELQDACELAYYKEQRLKEIKNACVIVDQTNEQVDNILNYDRAMTLLG